MSNAFKIQAMLCMCLIIGDTPCCRLETNQPLQLHTCTMDDSVCTLYLLVLRVLVIQHVVIW